MGACVTCFPVRESRYTAFSGNSEPLNPKEAAIAARVGANEGHARSNRFG